MNGAAKFFVLLQVIFLAAALFYGLAKDWDPATYYLLWAVMMRIILADMRVRKLLKG
jgi:hypothetical protein